MLGRTTMPGQLLLCLWSLAQNQCFAQCTVSDTSFSSAASFSWYCGSVSTTQMSLLQSPPAPARAATQKWLHNKPQASRKRMATRLQLTKFQQDRLSLLLALLQEREPAHLLHELAVSSPG